MYPMQGAYSKRDTKSIQKSNKNLQYISSSKDGSVKIWNAKTMKLIKNIDTFPEIKKGKEK